MKNYNIETLEVIGYVTRLTEQMLPTVVSPIFRVKGTSKIIFSFDIIHRDIVYGAITGDQEEFDFSVYKGDFTPLDPPKQAQRDFTLWIDQTMTARYETDYEVDTQLADITRRAIEEGLNALQRGDLNEADRQAGIGLSSGFSWLEPTAIKAAIRKKQGRLNDVRVMEEMAADDKISGLFSMRIFEYVVQKFYSLIPDDEEDCRRGLQETKIWKNMKKE